LIHSEISFRAVLAKKKPTTRVAGFTTCSPIPMVTTSGIQVIASTLSDGRSIVGARTLGGRTYESRPANITGNLPRLPIRYPTNVNCWVSH